MSPLSNATTLANYASGIGTQGATLEIQTANKRVGIGTTNPQGPAGSLQVGTAVTISGNSGIVSATTFHGDFGSSTSVAGNLSVSGVLTYEDVTNIDSVGIITARSGVSVPDGQKIQLGTGNDLQIYHTGSHSLIDEAGTGNLTIRSSLISFEKYTNEQLARFTADGSCELFHDNSKKFETTSGGISVTGTGTFTGRVNVGANDLDNRAVVGYNDSNDAGSITANNYTSTGPVWQAYNASVNTSTATSTIFADGSATFAGGATFGGNLELGDNNRIRLGAGDDLQIYHNGSDSYIHDAGTGDLIILANNLRIANTSGTNYITGISGGATELKFGGNTKLATSSAGVSITGAGTFAGDINIGAYNGGSTATDGVLLGAGGGVYSQLAAATASSGVVWQGMHGNTYTSRITAAGAATFFARSSLGTTSLSDHAIVAINSNAANGVIVAQNMNASGALLQGYNSSSAKTVEIFGSGIATFASQVSTSDRFDANRTGSSDSVFNGRLNNTLTSSILANGAATFGPLNISSSTGYGAQVDMAANAATVKAQCQQTASALTLLFAGYMGTNKNFHVTAGGAAEFTGYVTSNEGFYVSQTAAPSAASIFKSWYGSTTYVDILDNGSATFNGTSLFKIHPDSTVAAGVNNGSGFVSQLNHDGSATFGGDVICANSKIDLVTSSNHGEIRVRNSGGSLTSYISGSTGTGYFGGQLFVNTTSAIASGQLSVLFNGTVSNGITLQTTRAQNNSTFAVFVRSDGTTIGYITQNAASSTHYATSSDYRLKENVTAIPDGINRVKQLKPCRFNFIDDSTQTVDGFLAHEAQAVVPESVIGTKDEVDDEGKAVMQGIDQSKLVPLLTAALQEAIAKIETLETKVAALEG